jgi:hypothetical protein
MPKKWLVVLQDGASVRVVAMQYGIANGGCLVFGYFPQNETPEVVICFNASKWKTFRPWKSGDRTSVSYGE